jgi:hypothetical protein
MSDNLRTVYLGAVTVPDGYNGRTITVHLCYEPARGITWEVYPFGYHRSRYPRLEDYWRLEQKAA